MPGPRDTFALFKKANGILTEIAHGGIDSQKEFLPFGTITKNGTTKVFVSGKEVISTTDPFLNIKINDSYDPIVNLGALSILTQQEIKQIDKYVSQQSQQRNKIYYLDIEVTKNQAELARVEAYTVLQKISKIFKTIGLTKS